MRVSTAILCGSLLLVACAADEEDENSGVRDLDVDPIVDVNETSATFGQQVVPSDYEGVVSAWYFGHSS